MYTINKIYPVKLYTIYLSADSLCSIQMTHLYINLTRNIYKNSQESSNKYLLNLMKNKVLSTREYTNHKIYNPWIQENRAVFRAILYSSIKFSSCYTQKTGLSK